MTNPMVQFNMAVLTRNDSDTQLRGAHACAACLAVLAWCLHSLQCALQILRRADR